MEMGLPLQKDSRARSTSLLRESYQDASVRGAQGEAGEPGRVSAGRMRHTGPCGFARDSALIAKLPGRVNQIRELAGRSRPCTAPASRTANLAHGCCLSNLGQRYMTDAATGPVRSVWQGYRSMTKPASASPPDAITGKSGSNRQQTRYPRSKDSALRLW
jgi:hypothetical protein